MTRRWILQPGFIECKLSKRNLFPRLHLNNMRRFFTFILILGLMGCAVDYEDNRRAHFSGSLVEEDGNPLANIRVELLVETFGFKNSNFPTINSTVTDENGNFELLSIEPKNKVLYLDFGSGVLSLLRLQESGNNSGPYYDLGELKINSSARLDVLFIDESESNDTVYVEYEYKRYRPLNNFPEGWIDAFENDREDLPEIVQNRRTIIPNPQYELSINTLLNSEINVRYSIGESLEESDNIQELSFTISQDQIQHEVTY